MYQFNAQHNAVFATPRISATWNTVFPSKINGGLAIAGNLLYTTNFDHSVYALDLRSGTVRWRTVTDNVMMSTPVIAHGVIVVGSGHDGWLNPRAPDPQNQIWGREQGDSIYALLAATGTLSWKYRTTGDDMASPALYHDSAVFANGDLHAYGVMLQNGHREWRTRTLGVASMDSMTVDGGTAFFGTCRTAPRRCETLAINIANGRVIWRNPVGSPDASVTVGHGLAFTSALTLSEDGKFNQGGRSAVVALDERTGRTRWTWQSAAGPCTFVGSGEHEIAGTLADGLFFQSIGCNSRMVAFDAQTGRVQWAQPTWAQVKMSPIIYRGHVYFGDTNGVFYMLSERTGEIQRTLSFDQMFTTSPPVIMGNTIFIACTSEIYAMPLDLSVGPLEIPSRLSASDHAFVTDLSGQ